jgi:Fe-S-cluster containining protein
MNPCVSCGACCATYRVSFYWSEADPFLGGRVPPELTEQIAPTRLAMQGTNQKNPRCVALNGEIGCAVSCTIYEDRSSTCREFEAGSEGCQKARHAHGLPDLFIPVTPIVAA